MSKAVASVLQAVGHPLRVSILELLHANGETSVSDLIKQVKMEQSLVSHHLNILSRAGFAKGRRKGKFIFYSIASKELYDVLGIVKIELEKDKS